LGERGRVVEVEFIQKVLTIAKERGPGETFNGHGRTVMWGSDVHMCFVMDTGIDY
jgi:hypothetical protein